MEKILINTLKSLGATRRLIGFVDRNFMHHDISTVKLLEVIEGAVFDYYFSSAPTMYNVTRKRSVVYKRQIMHWMGRKYTRGSTTLIGDIFGMKDHATVLHSIRTVNNLMDTDKEYRKEVEEVEQKVKDRLNTTELWPRDSQTP